MRKESYTAAKVNLAALNSQIQADEKAAAGCRSELLKIEQRTEQIAAALEISYGSEVNHSRSKSGWRPNTHS